MEHAGIFQVSPRPEVPQSIKNSTGSLVFMQTEVDYHIAKAPGSTKDSAIIRIFGVTQGGCSVMVNVYSFEPYFWIKCPPQSANNHFTNELKNSINSMSQPGTITKIEIESRESIMGYTGDGQIPFLKIFTELPKQVASIRGLFERGLRVGNETIVAQTFESNIQYILRFMVDKSMVGMCWIEIPADCYNHVPEKTSHCQIEVGVDHSNLIILPCEGQWNNIAPLRILSFDIECNNNGESFPTADQNEIIQIGTVCKTSGRDDVMKYIFTLNTCADIPDAFVHSYQSEREMLEGWRNFVVEYDPDILTGYNILNFDYNYLFDRARVLKVQKFVYFGRIIKSQTRIRETQFQSKAQGLRDSREIMMEGRIQLDMLTHVQREHKLSHYTLNSVSLHFLKEQKEDVDWRMMRTLQAGNDETRRRIAVYCLKDCVLPLRLLEKLMCVVNYAEMARVSGVTVSWLLTRGQQIRVTSQLLRKAQQQGMLIPTVARGEAGERYEGAFVLPPVKNYFKQPIATLDFASLYPSIMIAHNLCYSTLLSSRMRLAMRPEMYVQTPTDDCFVKSEVRKGILPQVLEELISARKRTREEIKTVEDPFIKKVLDGRQLALKIAANSVYGFTGAQVGQLPCLEISSSVTAFGRVMIEFTRDYVQNHYTTMNGYTSNATVIYGDTDSVMVDFGVPTIEEAMRLGLEASQLVSQQFTPPIKLEFEKVYCPYLLMSKKRYAGLLWTRKDIYDKIDAKGIESVRRDNCQVVRDTINMVLDKLLIQRDEKEAVYYVQRVVSALLQNKIDLSMLVITKALAKRTNAKGGKNNYVAKQAHVELAKRMAIRDPANAPQVGDRIPYVMIKGIKGQKAYELAEDPIYVLNNDLPIDFDYYLEKQLKKPLLRLFKNVVPDPQSLFKGEHTTRRYQPKAHTGAMARFIKITATCVNCRSPIQSGALCKNCLDKGPEIYTRKVLELGQYERMFNELWTECQRCQGSFKDEVLCNNRDCPIFYRREKVRKEIATARVDLDKFNNTSW